MRYVAVGTIALAIALGASGGGGGGGTATFFIGQSTAGNSSGSSCSNQQSAAYFNTAGNWGAGHSIAPGVVVGLCGTITSTLTVQGSGTAGNPITLQFQTGAKLEQPVCAACLQMSNVSYIVVDGNNTGQIDSSANGTNLANKQASTGVRADPCTNCEIKNLTLGPFYTIASGDTSICSSGCAIDNAGVKCIWYSGANWTIDGNTMHDASWCLYEFGNGADGNEKIYGNNVYNMDHGWAITGSGPFGHLYFHNNHFHDMGLWDFCNFGGNNCHHDGIHCFFGSTPQTFADSYLYDNTFDGTIGASATAWIYLESNPTSACATTGSHWYIFNNKLSSSDQVPTNPYQTVAASSDPNTVYDYNNTITGPGGGHFGANQAACSDSSVDYENNAVGGCDQFNGFGTGVTDFNAYANPGGAAANCWPVSGGTCTFATWQGAGHDTHGVFSASGAVGSNVSGVGTNLTSLCSGDLVPLCTSFSGSARPTSGAWDAGAG